MNNYKSLLNQYIDFKDKYENTNNQLSKWFIFTNISLNKIFIACVDVDFSILIFENRLPQETILYLINNENYDYSVIASYIGIGLIKYSFEDDYKLRAYDKKIGEDFKKVKSRQIDLISTALCYLDAIYKSQYDTIYSINDPVFFDYIVNDEKLTLTGEIVSAAKFQRFDYKFPKIKYDLHFDYEPIDDIVDIDLLCFELPIYSELRGTYVNPFILSIMENDSGLTETYVIDCPFRELNDAVLDILSKKRLGNRINVTNCVLYNMIKRYFNPKIFKVTNSPLSFDNYINFVSLEINIYNYLKLNGDLDIYGLNKAIDKLNAVFKYLSLNQEDDGSIDEYLFESSDKDLFDFYNEIRKDSISENMDLALNIFQVRISNGLADFPSDEDENDTDENIVDDEENCSDFLS